LPKPFRSLQKKRKLKNADDGDRLSGMRSLVMKGKKGTQKGKGQNKEVEAAKESLPGREQKER